MAQSSCASAAPVRLFERAPCTIALHRMRRLDVVRAVGVDARRRRRESPRACPSSCCAARVAVPPLARQRLRRRLVDRPVRAAFAAPTASSPASASIRVAVATWPGSPECEAQASASSSGAKPVAVGGAALDQRQRLQRLDRRARIDRPLDVAQRQHACRRRHRPPRPRRRCRLSTSAPRSTSTRTGLLIVHAPRTSLPRSRREPFILALSWIHPPRHSPAASPPENHRAVDPRPVPAADRGPRRALRL